MMQKPRKDRLSWGDDHMLQAVIASWRSADPSTQVGAVIVNKRNQIMGTGYNGFPRGICTSGFPWDRDKENPLDNKYAYVVHAEKNAIVNAIGPVEGCTLYVTLYPCNECAKDIIQAGITNIVYLSNKYEDTWQSQAAKRMFDHLDIIQTKHTWNSPDAIATRLNSLLGQIALKQ